MSNSYAPGSMLATPAWCRSKCRSEGVIVLYKSCNGVRDDISDGFRAGCSNGDRLPSTLGPGPIVFVGSLTGPAGIPACMYLAKEELTGIIAAARAPPNKARRLIRPGIFSDIVFLFSCITHGYLTSAPPLRSSTTNIFLAGIIIGNNQ